MSEEGNDGEKKSKAPLKIILLVLLVVTLIAGSVFATLFFAGFLDPKLSAEEAIAAMENPDAAEAAGKSKAKEEEEKDDEDEGEGEEAYLQIKTEFLSNLFNSQRMVQVQIAVMVIENEDKTRIADIEKHLFPVRSSLLKILAQKREDEIYGSKLRQELAEEFKKTMNDELEDRVGGRFIEELYFTEFIIQ
jgi:flagellar basal body-associated protein FliL